MAVITNLEVDHEGGWVTILNVLMVACMGFPTAPEEGKVSEEDG